MEVGWSPRSRSCFRRFRVERERRNAPIIHTMYSFLRVGLCFDIVEARCPCPTEYQVPRSLLRLTPTNVRSINAWTYVLTVISHSHLPSPRCPCCA